MHFIRFIALLTGLLIHASDVHAQIPKLNSYPHSRATIFLDFDGQYVTGTSWNWTGPIDAQPSGLSNDVIIEIFNRVSEDYRPFNLNITTDSTVYFAAPFDKRIRVIVTPTSDWYGRAGGISYVGSFNWGNETPAWIFSALLSNNAKFIAEACSHETGHTLGLQHQSSYDANCNKLSEYNDGQGDGEIGWAPIMGMGYYKNLTTWNTGPNTIACNSIQNDLSIIAGAPNNFGFRDDDYGNTPATAADIVFHDLTFSVNGLINTTGDVDAFKLPLFVPVNLKLNAIPHNVGSGNSGADIDIKVTIVDAQSNIIGVYNPASMLSVGIDTNLNAGDYFLLVTGTGNVNHSDYGSLGRYQLVARMDVTLPVQQFIVKAGMENGNHVLYWSYNADEQIKSITIEGSPDGKIFTKLVTLDPHVKTFSYRPLNNYSYYRLKAITENGERAYYSVITRIVDTYKQRPVQLLTNIIQQQVVCIAQSVHTYQLFDASGRILLKGTMVKGVNTIPVNHASRGMLFLRLGDGVGSWTERLIKQ